MRKSEWVEEGKLVILSIRGFTTGTSGGCSTEEIGDILTILDSRTYGKVKKEPGVNPLLFTTIEEQDSSELKRKITAVASGKDLDVEDDIFDRGSEGEEDDTSPTEELDSEEDESLVGEDKKKAMLRKKEEKRMGRQTTIATSRTTKYAREDEEIDIDAL